MSLIYGRIMSHFPQEISFILLQREFEMEDNAQGQLCVGGEYRKTFTMNITFVERRKCQLILQKTTKYPEISFHKHFKAQMVITCMLQEIWYYD